MTIRLTLSALPIFVFCACGFAKKKSDFFNKDKGDVAAAISEVDATANSAGLLSFVSPLGDPVVAGSEVSIEVNFDDKAGGYANGSWSLLYSEKVGGIADNKIIQKNMPLTKTAVTWDMSDVPEGTFYLSAVFNGDGKLSVSRGAATIHKNGGKVFGSNRSPAVVFAITNNNARFMETGNSTVNTNGSPVTRTLAWKGKDPDGEKITYTVSYTDDYEDNWIDVISDTEETSVEWNLPARPTRSYGYKLRITATDERGKTYTIKTKEFFGVTERSVTFEEDLTQPIAQNCLSCHNTDSVNNGQTGPAKNLLLTLYNRADEETGPNGIRNTGDNLLKRLLSTDPDYSMPRGGELTRQELSAFRLWYQSGRCLNLATCGN